MESSDGVERCSRAKGQCDASLPVQKLLVSTVRAA